MRIVSWSVAGAVTVLIAAAGTMFLNYATNSEPQRYVDDVEHFKYGSIGAEVNGYPYLVWRTLPGIFQDRIPEGWARFGFSSEPGRALPVGISVRKYGIPRVGFNCATCHTSTVNGGRSIILGAPANKLDIEAYLRFLIESSKDSRFTADRIFAEAAKLGAETTWLDRLVYRHYVIPKIVSTLEEGVAESRWREQRPPQGPGRTDAGNPWRARFGMRPESDSLAGSVDFPSLWNQKIRIAAWLHWDGNNNSLTERNLSAALAGGATEASLDHASIERVAAWSLVAPAPAYPFPIDAALADRGKALYADLKCASCHEPGGAGYGGTTAIAEIGTDSQRFTLFSDALVQKFGAVGQGRSWQFKHYRKSAGYANMPLDGIWARAPYLHNGSVPALEDLFVPPRDRPVRFLRGCDTYDPQRAGFNCAAGAEFDTRLPGNGNAGHSYGTELAPADRRALVEYLKTK